MRRQQDRLREAQLAMLASMQQSQSGHRTAPQRARPLWNRHVAPRVERSAAKLSLYHRATPDARPASVAFPRPGTEVFRLSRAASAGHLGHSAPPPDTSAPAAAPAADEGGASAPAAAPAADGTASSSYLLGPPQKAAPEAPPKPSSGAQYRESGLDARLVPEGSRLHLVAVHRVAPDHFVFAP